MCIGSLSQPIILTHTKTKPRTHFYLLALACWACFAWLYQIISLMKVLTTLIQEMMTTPSWDYEDVLQINFAKVILDDSYHKVRNVWCTSTWLCGSQEVMPTSILLHHVQWRVFLLRILLPTSKILRWRPSCIRVNQAP